MTEHCQTGVAVVAVDCKNGSVGVWSAKRVEVGSGLLGSCTPAVLCKISLNVL